MRELKYWATAFIMMTLVSAAIIYPRLLHTPLFVVEFELCIFYIPTLVLGLICLRLVRIGAHSRF